MSHMSKIKLNCKNNCDCQKKTHIERNCHEYEILTRKSQLQEIKTQLWAIVTNAKNKVALRQSARQSVKTLKRKEVTFWGRSLIW